MKRLLSFLFGGMFGAGVTVGLGYCLIWTLLEPPGQGNGWGALPWFFLWLFTVCVSAFVCATGGALGTPVAGAATGASVGFLTGVLALFVFSPNRGSSILLVVGMALNGAAMGSIGGWIGRRILEE
jgi:hypothetical protein